MARLAVLTCFVMALAVVLGGFLGALHPLGDSLAVFRLPLTGGLVAVSAALAVWSPRAAAVGAGVALVSGLSVMLGLNPFADDAGHDLTLYQKNLSFRMADPGPLLADIRASGAEVVTLQEVSTRLRPILTRLSDTHPHSAFCPFYTVIGGVAVVSKHKITETRCTEGSGMVAAKIEPDSGVAFWAVSIHLHWPFPYRQSEQLARLLPDLAALDGHVVVGGDFNMVPWGHATRMIRQATNTSRTKGPLTTFTRFGIMVPLPIDQVFGPDGGTALPRPKVGSDHLGLLAKLPYADL